MSNKKPTNRSDYIAPQERAFLKLHRPSPSHDDIAVLADGLCERRGRGDGGAEWDWIEAERLLLEHGKGHAA